MIELKAEELKLQYDQSQAYAKGYADGYGAALSWIAQKLANGEKANNGGHKDTRVQINKDSAKTSKT